MNVHTITYILRLFLLLGVNLIKCGPTGLTVENKILSLNDIMAGSESSLIYLGVYLGRHPQAFSWDLVFHKSS